MIRSARRRLSIGLACLAVLAAPVMAAPETAQARFDAAADATKAAMLTNPRDVIARAERARPLAAALPDAVAQRTALATLLWLESEALFRLEDLPRAAPLIERALTLVLDAKPSKLQADILLTRGSIHGKQVKVAEALGDFQAAHRLFRELKIPRSEAIALICLATLYLDAKDYRSTLRYLDEAEEAHRADPGLAFAIYNIRGIALQDQGQYQRADVELRKALGYARQVRSPTVEVQYLRNIARNHLMAGQLGKADGAIAAARALPASGRDDAMQLDAVSAQAAFQHGRLREAGSLISRAFAGVDLSKTALPLRDAHQTAVAIYQAQGRAEQALGHLQALKRLDDQATKLAAQTNTALMAARFDSANQEARIARLRDAERLRQAQDEVRRARTERTLWLGASGATAVIILLLLFGNNVIRRSRNQVRAANADLAVTNTALGKALAAKTEFLATTSHEIRTPLNGILGMTQVMLADGALAPAARDRLTVVHDAGLTMRALVDDILDVAKMETGNLGLERAPFALRTLLQDASRLWAEQAEGKGLTFSLDLDRCPARVEGDAARVRQIVFNLLSNAVKFTAGGSVSLRAEEAGDGIRITVRDTGIGIAPEQQEAVFESFRQADASTTRQFGGTGLGLSICRNLARAMGGEVTLESVRGQGSIFTIDLPLPTLPDPAPVRGAPDGRGTLLIIDRNPIARAMFRTLFAPHVASVIFAGSADEAIASLAGGDIDRVLVDEATAAANGDPESFVGAVVGAAHAARVSLLWPAAGADGTRATMTALGVDQVIAKPITGAALVERLFAKPDDLASESSLVPQAA